MEKLNSIYETMKTPMTSLGDIPLEIRKLSLAQATDALNLGRVNLPALTGDARADLEQRLTFLTFHIAVRRGECV